MAKWLGCLALVALGLFVIFKLPMLVFIVGGLGTASFLGAWAHHAWEGRRTRRAFEAMHGRHGRRLILVYSRSPHWQRYVEEHWLPKYGAQAVILDWSDRSAWRGTKPKPMKIALFERHAGQREYNPLVIGVPVRGKVRVIRFWRAFRDHKHGRDLALRRAEAELELLAAELRGESDAGTAEGTAGSPR
jgi:hypothetical protein